MVAKVHPKIPQKIHLNTLQKIHNSVLLGCSSIGRTTHFGCVGWWFESIHLRFLKMKKRKEREEERKERLRLNKTMSTKIVPNKKKKSPKNYNVRDELDE